MGWLDSIQQSLQLFQGCSLVPSFQGACLSSLPSFCLRVPCLSTSWKWSLSALKSAGTSMLLTWSIFLGSSVSGVICPEQLSSSGILDSPELPSARGGMQVIWWHILWAGVPSHGQVETGVTDCPAEIHQVCLSLLLSWPQWQGQTRIQMETFPWMSFLCGFWRLDPFLYLTLFSWHYLTEGWLAGRLCLLFGLGDQHLVFFIWCLQAVLCRLICFWVFSFLYLVNLSLVTLLGVYCVVQFLFQVQTIHGSIWMLECPLGVFM